MDHLNQSSSESKKEDYLTLLEYFKGVLNLDSKMWGPSLIGYGKCSYTYASGHHGEAAILGFSPGKAKQMSLYILIPYSNMMGDLLEKLGKYKAGKPCLYIQSLKDVNLPVLK